DLRISVKLPERLPDIAADRRRLAEVLQNLLDNAMQYTPAGGQIMVSASANGAEMTFTVSDTGIGIPQADQPRIFERFYRVDVARSREVGGTGLGLSIANILSKLTAAASGSTAKWARVHSSISPFPSSSRSALPCAPRANPHAALPAEAQPAPNSHLFPHFHILANEL